MLAPCGITCSACYAHVRRKRTCPGCRREGVDKQGYCARCKIRNCAAERGVGFCHECESFPCTLAKGIDKRYRLRYKVSLIENNLRMRAVGEEEHAREEKEKWTCARCGGVISLHDRSCSECGSGMD